MAAQDVEFEAIMDIDGRFGRLAELLGLADADHARGKVEHLWMACTTRGETDLPQWLVEQKLGPRGPEALVESGLARWGRGRGDSKTRRMYIRGSRKRCLWLRNNQDQSSKGGESRARNSSRTEGRFDSEPIKVQESATELTSLPTTLADQTLKSSEGKVENTSPLPSPSPSPSPFPSLFPEEDARSATPPRPRKEPTSDHGRTIAVFDQRFRERFGQPPTWGPKQAGQVKQLLARHPADEVIRRIAILFDSPPAFLLNSPPDVATLVQHFDKLVAPATMANGTRAGPPSREPEQPRKIPTLVR